MCSFGDMLLCLCTVQVEKKNVRACFWLRSVKQVMVRHVLRHLSRDTTVVVSRLGYYIRWYQSRDRISEDI